VLKQNADEPGLRWMRENDMGLPVDRLEIDGNISDTTAKQLEELLWQSIPAEYQHLRGDRIDAIMINEGKRITSYPLALTQLLIAYHVLQAAASRE